MTIPYLNANENSYHYHYYYFLENNIDVHFLLKKECDWLTVAALYFSSCWIN
ncbi:MAG: hypothetical protein ACI9LL_000455 [Porticoccus sp.]|jgi:hypothetical protein